MAVQYNFKPSCDGDNDSCFAPRPDFDCVQTCTPCDNPCEPKCPPKVRIQDAVCLSDEEVERCFSLYQYRGCEPVRVPVHIYSLLLRVRKQGMCRVLTEECPRNMDRDGNVCFMWSDDFRELPAGYYEADLFINDKNCYTWLFRKRGCWAKLETEKVTNEELPCDAPCGVCRGCVPIPDIEPNNTVGDCGGCNGNQC